MLDNSEWYIYNDGESIILLFNCIYELVGAILDGQNCLSLDKLDAFQKVCIPLRNLFGSLSKSSEADSISCNCQRMVEDSKRRAYKNLNHLIVLEDPSLIGQAVLASNLQIGFSHIPISSQQIMNYPVEQGTNYQYLLSSVTNLLFYLIFSIFYCLLLFSFLGGGD